MRDFRIDFSNGGYVTIRVAADGIHMDMSNRRGRDIHGETVYLPIMPDEAEVVATALKSAIMAARQDATP